MKIITNNEQLNITVGEKGSIKIDSFEEKILVEPYDLIILNLTCKEKNVKTKYIFALFSKIGPLRSLNSPEKKLNDRERNDFSICFERKLSSLETRDILGRVFIQSMAQHLLSLNSFSIISSTINEKSCNLLIKKIPCDLTAHDFFSLLGNFGEIMSLKLACDDKNKSLGFGFIYYSNSQSFQLLQEYFAKNFVNGKRLLVDLFFSEPKLKKKFKRLKKKFTNVYIKNIDRKFCNESFLRDIFSVFGNITSIHVPLENETPRGFGFVNFYRSGSAKFSVSKINSKKIGLFSLYAGKFEKKSEREEKLRKKRTLKVEKNINFQRIYPLLELKSFDCNLLSKILETHKREYSNFRFSSKKDKISEIIPTSIKYNLNAISEKFACRRIILKLLNEKNFNLLKLKLKKSQKKFEKKTILPKGKSKKDVIEVIFKAKNNCEKSKHVLFNSFTNLCCTKVVTNLLILSILINDIIIHQGTRGISVEKYFALIFYIKTFPFQLFCNKIRKDTLMKFKNRSYKM